MKRELQLLSVGIIFISLIYSCTIEKRRYSSGYNIEWNNTKQGKGRGESAQDKRPGNDAADKSTEQPINSNATLHKPATPSADISNGITADLKTEVKETVDVLPEECDVITLKNGDEIKAKVSEISGDVIKYKLCDNLNGPIYTLKKSDVFMINYPNGTKDVFTESASTEPKSNSTEKEDSGIFGILSFLCTILGIIFVTLLAAAGATGFVAFLIFATLAIVLGAIGIGKDRKLRGLAVVGMTIGIAAILLLIFYAIALNIE